MLAVSLHDVVYYHRPYVTRKFSLKVEERCYLSLNCLYNVDSSYSTFSPLPPSEIFIY